MGRYYRTQVSSDAFSSLDHYLWQLTYKWATHSHTNKPTSWVTAQYFGRFNKARQDRWVFGHRASGAFMQRFAWTKIVRHRVVRYRASPDDPTLTDYWAWRRKEPLPINKTTHGLLKTQDGHCPTCREHLLATDHRPQSPHQWEQWLAITRTTTTIVAMRDATTDETEPRLIHAHCRDRGNGPALLPAYEPPRLA